MGCVRSKQRSCYRVLIAANNSTKIMTLDDAFSTLYVAWGNIGEIWSASGQNKGQYTERIINKYTYNYSYNFCLRIFI